MFNKPNHLLAHLLIALALVLGLKLTLGLATPPSPVWACTPPPGGLPQYTPAERTQAAEVVLEGTVEAVTDPFFYQTATVIVHRYFKGAGPAVVMIDNLGSSALCLSQVYIGQRAIFYTQGNPESGLLHAHYLSQFDAVDPVQPDIVAEVIAAAGQEPVLPTTYWFYLPVILKP